MKIPQAFLLLIALVTTIHALVLPDATELISESSRQLFKRRGGGGGKGGSSGSSGSGGSKGGSTSSGSSSSHLGSSSSNTGGRTSSGTGAQPKAYGGGAYYGGGAAVPYISGHVSPGGIRPAYIGGAGLLFFPGIWLYGAYAYNYPQEYTYHNDTTNTNQTRPVECLCANYNECGCDSNNETDYVDSVANNKTIARVAEVDGVQKLVINGTLPNGTTVAGAAGSFRHGIAEMSGWWVVIAGVVYTIWFM